MRPWHQVRVPECRPGHLYSLAWIVEQGWVKPPFFVQMVFGILGEVGADLDNLMHMHDRRAVRGKLPGRSSRPGATRCPSRRRPRCWAVTSASAWGQPLYRPRPEGDVERRAGQENPRDRPRTWPNGGYPGRSASASASKAPAEVNF